MVTAKNTQVNVTVADVDGVMGLGQVNQTALGQALAQGLQQQQVAVRTV
jgi:flagella basal body P-ring formation protein FlgA